MWTEEKLFNAIDFLLDRAVRFEAMANKNRCYSGGPRLTAEENLELAMAVETDLNASRFNEAKRRLNVYGLSPDKV